VLSGYQIDLLALCINILVDLSIVEYFTELVSNDHLLALPILVQGRLLVVSVVLHVLLLQHYVFWLLSLNSIQIGLS